MLGSSALTHGLTVSTNTHKLKQLLRKQMNTHVRYLAILCQGPHTLFQGLCGSEVRQVLGSRSTHTLCLCLRMRACVCVYKCVCMCMCARVCVCVFVWSEAGPGFTSTHTLCLCLRMRACVCVYKCVCM